jgi:DNA-binding SARP family transcriptional activator/basic membrane lipoprotein Med (substrate-binding protein (PBP1-ABC) superfamily)
LALLLLKADEVVSVERLIDELWGEDPPASAAHSIEAYVSRLRTSLSGLGPELARVGSGYCLRLKGAVLDARAFLTLAEDPTRSSEALALWRGRALMDVTLGPSGRAEAERLDELRLRVLEQRIDEELALGREEDLVGELQILVTEHPYRERFVVQLMLALYRTGRHAHALEVYERTRGVLDEVGLQPSVELQQLSGRIVRQEADLTAPASARRVPPAKTLANARGVGLALAGAMSLALAVTVGGSAPHRASASPAEPNPARVALVVPRSPSSDEASRRYRVGLHLYGTELNSELQVETIIGEAGPKLMNGGFGLVIWAVDEGTRDVGELVEALPSTKFVFLDTSLKELSLEGVANASAVRFAIEQTTELVGYLAGLVHPRRGGVHERADVIGVVGGSQTSESDRNLAGFKRGLAATGSRAKVLVGYANETVDRTPCERLANSQIDRGADIVFALAGRCGSGALEVARVRGVWGAGDGDAASRPADESSDLLVRMHKEYEMAMQLALTRFLDRDLPLGQDMVLGLNDNYAVGLSTSWTAPTEAVSRMIDRCSEIRRQQSLGTAP